ncbi:MAG: hypothetical protein OQJ89_01005 [Kangiellaceae bacterium]|nr:hypothetical protein [Kangiellaceae bacterium]
MGALAGMISGAITVVLWIQFKADLGGTWAQLYEMIPGVIVSVASIILVSLYGPQNEQQVGEDFDHVNLTLKGNI